MLGGGWVKEKFEMDSGFKYDVQKTSSLISPYIANSEFIIKRTITAFHKSKEDALTDNIFITDLKFKHKHYYAFQKGTWIITKREYNVFSDEWFDCSEIIKEGETKGETNIHGCFEKLQ